MAQCSVDYMRVRQTVKMQRDISYRLPRVVGRGSAVHDGRDVLEMPSRESAAPVKQMFRVFLHAVVFFIMQATNGAEVDGGKLPRGRRGEGRPK